MIKFVVYPYRQVWMKWKEQSALHRERQEMKVVALQFWAYRIQAQVGSTDSRISQGKLSWWLAPGIVTCWTNTWQTTLLSLFHNTVQGIYPVWVLFLVLSFSAWQKTVKQNWKTFFTFISVSIGWFGQRNWRRNDRPTTNMRCLCGTSSWWLRGSASMPGHSTGCRNETGGIREVRLNAGCKNKTEGIKKVKLNTGSRNETEGTSKVNMDNRKHRGKTE